MDDSTNFYFCDDLFETMSKNHIYLGTNFKTCSCCDKLIENISPVTLFHNYLLNSRIQHLTRMCLLLRKDL